MESEFIQEIREAIAAQDYALAFRLWNAYVSKIRQESDEGSFPAERMAELRDLFKWGRDALLCARSQYLDHLNAIHVVAAYTSTYTSTDTTPTSRSNR
jgi:hypothetical protein